MSNSSLTLVQEKCEGDFMAFVALVAPYMHLGSIHHEAGQWLTRQDASDNMLLLLPRGHLKSKLTAFLAAWWITRDPTETILYVSATAALAEAQLFQIKQIFESSIYRRYWPDMINVDEGKREKWTVSEIAIDHPLRRKEGIRDQTIRAVGLTANTTGFHSSKTILDDVVVPGNAYTEEGRHKVSQFYSQLASIENPGAKQIVVGTRYGPKDLYQTLTDLSESIYDANEKEWVDKPVFEVFLRVVETSGDFLWPRTARIDGRRFGFDEHVLARIKAKYIDVGQFYCQYYQQPNHSGSDVIDRDRFQYYDRKHLEQREGYWFFKEDKLNTFAAIDFAFSIRRSADYTSIVVIGVTSEHDYYVLDLDRFKSDKIKDYFERIYQAHCKWGFKKLRAEVTNAQQAIVTEIKESYIKPLGLTLSIDEYRPTRNEGSKQERIESVLSHKYDNYQIWHYHSGNTQLLEEELIMQHPAHDDLKEGLANAIAVSKAPSKRLTGNVFALTGMKYNARFGGVL